MCRPRTRSPLRALVTAATFGAVLAGCSDIYFDRRDTVALSGGDAVVANEVAQTIDPWPAHSGNANFATNGQKMQSAVERYRTNKVTPPVDPGALEVGNLQAPPTSASATRA